MLTRHVLHPHLRYHVTLLCDPHPVNHFSVKVAPEVNLARMQVKTSPATLVTALGMHLAGMILPSDAVSRRVYVYLCVCVCVLIYVYKYIYKYMVVYVYVFLSVCICLCIFFARNVFHSIDVQTSFGNIVVVFPLNS
jgi:hypothetical protein